VDTCVSDLNYLCGIEWLDTLHRVSEAMIADLHTQVEAIRTRLKVEAISTSLLPHTLHPLCLTAILATEDVEHATGCCCEAQVPSRRGRGGSTKGGPRVAGRAEAVKVVEVW
jgi:hypothetical protein